MMTAKKIKAAAQKSTAAPIFIVTIDPDAKNQNAFRGHMENTEFTPITFSSIDEAKVFLEKDAVSTVAVICDLKQPVGSAIEFRKFSIEQWRQVPFIISADKFPQDFSDKFTADDSCHQLRKPYTRHELLHLINEICNIRIEEIKLEREAIWESIEKFTTMLEEMETMILTLENHPKDAEAIQRIFGILHTIKGGSSFFKNPVLSEFCHHCEDALEGVKNLSVPVTKSVITVLLQSKDTIWEIINALEAGEENNLSLEQLCTIFKSFKTDLNAQLKTVDKTEPEKQKESTRGKSQKTKDWLKVPRSHIEDFLKINGEMTITKNMIDKFIKLELSAHRSKNMEHLAKLFEQFFKHQQDMQNKMMNLKKVSLTETFLQVRRDVRNLCEELDKQVDVFIEGEKNSVDDSVIETINASLVHIIRNSIDHGIEKPEARTAAGKPAKGTLQIRAFEEDERIFIEIKDDGKGIDHERLRKVIVEKGLYTEVEAAKMDRKQLVSMIFRSGVSTSKNITSISGRGIGLDMVYNSILQIQGKIEVDSELGKGTKFTLHLPIPKSVVIFRSLVVAHNNGTYAIPQEHISQVMSTSQSELANNATVQNISGQVMLKLRTGTIQLFDLQHILEGYPDRDFKYNPDSAIVLINGLHKTYGIVVNSIMGIEDTVVKGLGHTGSVSTIYLGATIFGDGQVGLILSPHGISKQLQF